MAKIMVLDPLSEEGLALLRSSGKIEVEVKTGLKGEDLRNALMNADGAICRSGVKITADILEGNTRLRAIARAGVGVDNIDCKKATQQGIVVMNTPGGNTLSTAEQAITLMMALSRNVFPAYRSLIEGRWDRKKFTGTQLAGKTLGIVGLGRIGQAIAVRCAAMEMNLVGYDPYISPARAKELGITLYGTVDEMLPVVDYLTVHTPLTDETRNLIDREQIDRIKPGARLINAARGGIYNEEALVEGLKSGKLGGVALDVYPTEPCTDSPLFGMDHVVCTPHLGASTTEAQQNVALEAAQLLLDYFTTGTIRQSVNSSSLDPKTLVEVKSWLVAAYRLGLFISQFDRAAMHGCRITFRGEITQKDTALIARAFAVGLMERSVDPGTGVNIVNAEALLKQRGVELVEERASGDSKEFRSTMKVVASTDAGELDATATLFGDSVRLVRLNGCRLESPLEGNILAFTHRDQPGVIGQVGGIFGKYGVNIAGMTVGRATAGSGSEALGVLTLDAPAPSEAVSALLALPAVSKAMTLTLPAPGALPAWLS
ncbi:MAG: phosphoglycerate dehydrogenase [Planctomycetia bacterium]|nr:phosphoglycerate dehydrogenase [Planctomycetia bacterium]